MQVAGLKVTKVKSQNIIPTVRLKYIEKGIHSAIDRMYRSKEIKELGNKIESMVKCDTLQNLP